MWFYYYPSSLQLLYFLKKIMFQRHLPAIKLVHICDTHSFETLPQGTWRWQASFSFALTCSRSWLFPFQLVTQMRFFFLLYFYSQINIVQVQSIYTQKKKCGLSLAKIVTASFDFPLSDSNSPHQMFAFFLSEVMRIFREDRRQIFYWTTDRERSDNAFVNVLHLLNKSKEKKSTHNI